MKRFVEGCVIGVFAVYCLFTAVSSILPVTEWARPSSDKLLLPPCDFRLRLNELACLRDGVNPYSVWHEDVAKVPYYPLHKPEMANAVLTEPINAYTPWEYTMAMPFAWLPRRVAWGSYVILMFACLAVLLWGGYDVARRAGYVGYSAWSFAAIPLLVVAHPIWSNFCIGNYAVPILAALFMMCWCLDRGYDVWAGVFWAIAMIKPQNSLLLAVPLLMRGKIKTCAVAAAICLVASVPPAIMCKTSVVLLILQAPAASVQAFFGCATLPSYLCEFVGTRFSIPFAAVIGVVLCVLMTRWMRGVRVWLWYTLPAIMCSISWTYTTSYSYSFAWVLVLALMYVLVSGKRNLEDCALSVAAGVLLPRFYTAWHGFSGAFGLPLLNPISHYAIETTVSLLILILTLVFCRFAVARKWLRTPDLKDLCERGTRI